MTNATELKLKLGEELRAARKKLKLTQRDAALLSGRQYQDISNVENGKINMKIDNFVSLFNAYGLELEIKTKKLKP